MPKLPKPSELVSTGEVAEMIGVSPVTVRAYKNRRQMPEPYVVLACGPIWLRSDIQRWKRARAKRVAAKAAAPTVNPDQP